MSVAPNAGIIDFGTFTPPSGGQDGIQGQVPAPLSGQAGYVLTGNGWSSLGALGVISYQGTWNAATNTPTIVSGVGTQGYYYVVSVAGTTTIDGISSWGVGDWIIFNGSVWQKIDSGSTVDITGGQINNTLIGNITPSTGTFTTVGIDAPTTDATFTNDTGITGWVYSGKSFSVIGQESTPQGLFFRADGSKMYVVGSTGDDVNEYNLGTAWDVSTASFVAVSTGITQDSGPIDLFFKDDGLTLFVLGQTNDTVYQYTLSVAWNITTATYASKSFSVTSQEATPQGIWFKSDGTTMYITGSSSDAVFQYTLSTPWDVSTASYASISFSVAAQDISPSQVNLSADGTKMWVAGTNNDRINEYTLGTAWNVSTATFVNNVYVGFQEITPNGLFIDSTAANRVYIVGSSTDAIYQYNTATNTVGVTTDRLFVSGEGYVDGNFYADQNLYVNGTIGALGTATFGTTNVSGTFTASGSVNFSTTTSNISVGTSQTTGTLTLGGTTQTGAITVGQSTGAQTLNLGTGATTNGTTKTINIGTAGVSGSTTTINIGSAVSGALGNISMGNSGTQFLVAPTASAVNYVQVTGAATGNIPAITAQGSDTNVNLSLWSKGTASVYFYSNGGYAQFEVVPLVNAVNRLSVQGAIAGSAPKIFAQGSDTNISQVFQSKGTGAINLAPGSSGVNISNGGTVTAITTSSRGSGYTSIPTVAITAPTTAGGVQATATVALNVNSMTLGSGGTGYTVNDVLTLSGITGTAPTVRVDTVSSGVITAFTITGFGAGNVLAPIPSNPIGVTGGTGLGATFNVNWNIGNFTITNAGSGYVEQPTVTFSGGGGSGASAYASVGSTPIVRSLVGAFSFNTSAGEGLRINNPGFSTLTDYIEVQGGSNVGGAYVGVNGSTTNSNLYLSAKGTGSLNFFTNGQGNVRQFVVSHTASAVNYVQVTGSATTVRPTISAQGSDTNVGLNFATKGASPLAFYTSTNTLQAAINHIASAANYINLTGAAAGSAPIYGVAGSDTNIDLNLTTKGTGAVNLNTGNGLAFQVSDSGAAATTPIVVFSGTSTLNPRITSAGSMFYQVNGGVHRFDTSRASGGGTEQFRVSHTASAVNYVQVTGAATTANPIVSSQGSDTNIGFVLTSKGTGAISFYTNNSSQRQFRVIHTANAVNFLDITGAATGGSPSISVAAASTDTNIDLTLTPKGTGYVQFGTHTATALTISGYIEIKDSAGNVRKLAVVT